MARTQAVLCEETGALAMDGMCLVHGGDACLAVFFHYSVVENSDDLLRAEPTK